MNIEQAKTKLASVSNSTASKHPKTLVAELCVVIKFLLDELDKIKLPTMTSLSKRLPEDLEISPRKPIDQPIKPPPFAPPINDPAIRKYRNGNAGDAQ